MDEYQHFSGFTVDASGEDIPITYGYSDNDSIVLTLDEPGIVEAIDVNITYVDPSESDDDYAVQDRFGNDAKTQINFALTNGSTLDRSSPEIQSLKVEQSGLRITLLYDELLAQQPTAEPSDFVLYLDEIPYNDRVSCLDSQ